MSAFDAGLLSLLRRSAADVVYLLKIEITTPSALTLTFGTRDYLTPDGTSWDAGFSGDPIRDAVDFMGPGPNLVPWNFRLANRTLSHTGTTLGSLLHSYRFKGAAVTLYLWHLSQTDWTKAGVLYRGHITDTRPVPNQGVIDFVCSQPIDWNVVVPNKVVDSTNAPNSTDATLGLPYPIIVGDWGKPTMPDPFTNSATEIVANDESGGGRLAVPFLLVDPGTGAADVKVVAACHELSALFDQNNGYGVFTPGLNGTLAYFGTGGTATSVAAGESSITIDDGAAEVVVGIPPSAVNTAGAFFLNSAANPRAAMNPTDQTQYATIDQNASKTQLALLWPDVSTPGQISTTGGVGIFLAFAGATGNDGVHKVRMRLVNPQTGAVALTQLSSVAEATSAGVTIMTVSAYVAGMEDWRLSALTNRACVVVDFDGGTTNVAHVYWVAYKIPYRPQRNLLIPEEYGTRSQGRHRGRAFRWSFGTDGVLHSQEVFSGQLPDVEYRPAVYKFDAKLYGNVAGPTDDVGGTYTGTGSALIQRPPDVIRWLLDRFGGLDPAADFETGAGAFGSWTDLRTSLLDDWPDPFVCALYLGSKAQLGKVVKNVAASCLFSLWIDRFTGLWRVVPWKETRAATYDHAFAWDEIDLIGAESLSSLDACQEVRVQFGFDHYSQRPLGEAYVSPDGSGTGVTDITRRDQQGVTVDATNEYLEIDVSGFLFTINLTHATYSSPIEWCDAIQTRIRNLYGGGTLNQFFVNWSYCVKAGFNDSLAVKTGGTTYTATLTPGEMTADERAQDAQDALNGSGFPGTFTVTWDRTTGKFTVACTAAFDTVNTWTHSARHGGWHLLGFVDGTTGAATYTSDCARWGERYAIDYISRAVTVTVMFGSGAHAAACPAHELGFLPLDKAATGGVYGDSPRAMREATASALQTENGPRPADTVTADVLVDEASASRVRNRRFDMRSKDRVVVSFRTTMAPDLQRLQAIEFTASLDEHVPFPRYGSDGTWAGKVFRVVEVTQYVADAQCHSEVTAVEMW